MRCQTHDPRASVKLPCGKKGTKKDALTIPPHLDTLLLEWASSPHGCNESKAGNPVYLEVTRPHNCFQQLASSASSKLRIMELSQLLLTASAADIQAYCLP